MNSHPRLMAAGMALLACVVRLAAQPAPPAPIRIHVAEGMWSEHWRLPEALAPLGPVTESFLCSRYGFVTSLKGFPQRKEELLAQQVLVLANIPADAFTREGTWGQMRDVPGRSAAWVEEFVAGGGGLLVLGGNYALGIGGGYVGSPLEALLPADIHRGDINFDTQNRPLALTPVTAHPATAGLDWGRGPVTLFYHEVVAKPEATVLAKAGDAPVILAGQYKAGRVILITATLHGEPAEGLLPWWQWDGWPRLARGAVAWLAGGRDVRPGGQ